MHSEDAHTDPRAAGYALTRRIHASADRSSLARSRDSLTSTSSVPGECFPLILVIYLNLNIQIRRALAVHRAVYLRRTHPYLCVFICATPLRLFLSSALVSFFLLPSLTVAGVDLFTGECLIGGMFVAIFRELRKRPFLSSNLKHN